jgi:hypothetical protein
MPVGPVILMLVLEGERPVVVRWVVGEMLIEVEAGKASVIVTAR